MGQAEAGYAVQEQQDRLTLVAEVLGDGQGCVGGFAARECRGIGGRDHDDRAGEAGRAEVVLDELAHLASALANERENGHVTGRVPRHHREQRRFADARSGEQAESLPLAAGGEQVERAHAEIEPPAEPRPRRRRGSIAPDGARGLALR